MPQRTLPRKDYALDWLSVRRFKKNALACTSNPAHLPRASCALSSSNSFALRQRSSLRCERSTSTAPACDAHSDGIRTTPQWKHPFLRPQLPQTRHGRRLRRSSAESPACRAAACSASKNNRGPARRRPLRTANHFLCPRIGVRPSPARFSALHYPSRQRTPPPSPRLYPAAPEPYMAARWRSQSPPQARPSATTSCLAFPAALSLALPFLFSSATPV